MIYATILVVYIINYTKSNKILESTQNMNDLIIVFLKKNVSRKIIICTISSIKYKNKPNS